MDQPNPPRSAFISASWEQNKSQAKSQKNANLEKWLWRLSALLPLGAMYWAFMTTGGPGEDPSMRFFGNWFQGATDLATYPLTEAERNQLIAQSQRREVGVGDASDFPKNNVLTSSASVPCGEGGTNPLPFHAPYRSDDTLIYKSGRPIVHVRAAIAGRVSKIDEQTLELTGKHKSGLPLKVYYKGLTAISVNSGDVVGCGSSVGTLQNSGNYTTLLVSVKVNGKPLMPPVGLRLPP